MTTAGDLLVRGARRWPTADAVVFPDSRRSYSELLAGAEAAARSLLGLGLSGGDRVGILMPNCQEFLDVFLGCQLLGIVAVPINARFKSRELAYIAENAELAAIVTTDLISEYAPFPDLLLQAFAGGRPSSLRHLVLLGRSSPAGFLDRSGFDAAGAGVGVDEVHRHRARVGIRSVALMMFTSGTTATPKGCPLSHEALVRTGISVAGRWRLAEGERFWDPLPLFHMSGVLPLVALLHSGGCLLTMTRFEAGAALAQMRAEAATFLFPTFPTLIEALLLHPEFAAMDWSRVRGVNATGDPGSLRRIEAMFAGPRVVGSYGLTECGGVICFGDPDDDLEARVSTGGRPFPGMEVRVVDPESGAPLGPGVRGELQVRGVGMFEGYHGDPAKNAESFTADGWFRTGDLGTVDGEGRVAYRGRIKDMLKVGGENVAALEIEAELLTHPAVKIAQVVGVPDPRLVEVPAAFVELNPGATVSEEELVVYCKGRIAGFKVPRHVRFVNEWPISATKVQKYVLRDRLLAELGLASAG